MPFIRSNPLYFPLGTCNARITFRRYPKRREPGEARRRRFRALQILHLSPPARQAARQRRAAGYLVLGGRCTWHDPAWPACLLRPTTMRGWGTTLSGVARAERATARSFRLRTRGPRPAAHSFPGAVFSPAGGGSVHLFTIHSVIRSGTCNARLTCLLFTTCRSRPQGRRRHVRRPDAATLPENTCGGKRREAPRSVK